MSKKHWIYIKRGLSEDAKHRAQMGECIWLYMHIIDRADWEMGIAYDWRDGQEAADMGMSIDTLRSQRQKLEKFDYIRCLQKQRGQDVKIMEWKNPRDYGSETKNPRNQSLNESIPTADEGGIQSLNHRPSQVKTLPLDSESESKSISVSFDLEQADIGWAVAGGKPVTEKQLITQHEIADFEEMIEAQLRRFPLNWGGFKGVDQDRFRHHLKEFAEKGETLTAYMDWWISNFIQKEQPPWTLGQIMIRWPQAFAVSTQPKHSEGRAIYGKYAEERNTLGL